MDTGLLNKYIRYNNGCVVVPMLVVLMWEIDHSHLQVITPSYYSLQHLLANNPSTQPSHSTTDSITFLYTVSYVSHPSPTLLHSSPGCQCKHVVDMCQLGTHLNIIGKRYWDTKSTRWFHSALTEKSRRVDRINETSKIFVLYIARQQLDSSNKTRSKYVL